MGSLTESKKPVKATICMVKNRIALKKEKKARDFANINNLTKKGDEKVPEPTQDTVSKTNSVKKLRWIIILKNARLKQFWL